MAMAPPLQLSATQAAPLFKLLSDEPRLRLLLLLAGRGEMSVTALGEAVGLAQPAVSHHLALLRISRVVSCRREGKRIFYSLSSEPIREMLAVVKF